MVKELVGLKVRAKEERGKLSSLIKFQFGMGGEGEEEGANLIGWSFSCCIFQCTHKSASLEAMLVKNYDLLSYLMEQIQILKLLAKLKNLNLSCPLC